MRRGPGAPTRAADWSPTGPGVDVAFEAARQPGGPADAGSVRPGGRVVLAGHPGRRRDHVRASVARRKGLTIAMVRRMNHVYPRAISLAARGVVDLGVAGEAGGGGWARWKEAFGDAVASHRPQGGHRAWQGANL